MRRSIQIGTSAWEHFPTYCKASAGRPAMGGLDRQRYVLCPERRACCGTANLPVRTSKKCRPGRAGKCASDRDVSRTHPRGRPEPQRIERAIFAAVEGVTTV